jgi:CheY-like chemotaxis protein
VNNLFTILQVEDDENDVLFLRGAMKRACAEISLQTAVDGEQAIGYLSGSGRYADRQAYPLPALVLLDLHLPKIPGHDVLKWIREQPVFQTLPVVILTSSEADSDIETAYRLGAHSYFVKPVNPSDLLKIAQYILGRWVQASATTHPEEPVLFLKYPPARVN